MPCYCSGRSLGAPVARERSPHPRMTMPKYTPELVESVLHQYVYTGTPVGQIAAKHGVNERDITRMRHANGVAPRRARARELPDGMREAHEITKRLKAAAPAGPEVVGRNT